MKFHPVEIPVAISMIELAEHAHHPFQKYFSYWSAFNNIYTLIGRDKGLMAELVLDENHKPKTDKKWGYTFAKVKSPTENQQISEAVNQLHTQTKDVIIEHPNIRFFVERTPAGVDAKLDDLGQLINGVLNVTRTVNRQLPIWSPIDKTLYESYLSGDMIQRSILAEQIIFMLYTIRNNLVHGSKSMNEANDVKVVEMALPLLEILVRSFISQ